MTMLGCECIISSMGLQNDWASEYRRITEYQNTLPPLRKQKFRKCNLNKHYETEISFGFYYSN